MKNLIAKVHKVKTILSGSSENRLNPTVTCQLVESIVKKDLEIDSGLHRATVK